MLSCEELYKDTVKSMPTTPNIQVNILYIYIIGMSVNNVELYYLYYRLTIKLSTTMNIHPQKLLLKPHQRQLQSG